MEEKKKDGKTITIKVESTDAENFRLLQAQGIKKLDNLPILEVAKKLKINVLDASASACFVHKPTGPSIFFSPEANWFECIGEGGLKGGPVELVQEAFGCNRNQAEGWLFQNLIKPKEG